MKAIEATGIVDEKGILSLEQPVDITAHSRVRVIILYAEELVQEDLDPDDTPLEEVKASLRRSLEESKSGQRIPISRMWEDIDADS
jgi:predicted DNA-binding antitoxin AbrB/MazE fold protein